MSLLILRLAVIAGALVIWFWTQKLIARNALVAAGVGDGVHRLTAGWHHHFSTNRKSADRALVVSSFFIDVLGLSLIAMSVFGESFAPFLGMLIVFSLRQVSQLCCTLPPPPGIIWHHPGVPTALVTYDVGNDFFFSGHTALAVLAAIEICRIGPWWLGLIAVIVALGEALIVLVLRAHYTLDVITGALAAWLAADLALRLSPFVDVWLGR
ncbi:MAG: phosphatase PAP2 family protein [Verrucomicrobiaceae bacterium]|nr:MAG: phosphatase PAP2 family protein [Verrucomicrobiaceae bacterium]